MGLVDLSLICVWKVGILLSNSIGLLGWDFKDFCAILKVPLLET